MMSDFDHNHLHLKDMTKDHNYLHGLSLSFEILSNHQGGGVSHKTHPNPNLLIDRVNFDYGAKKSPP